MRYKSEGEVHKDFHGLTCATIHYLIDTYGIESLCEVMTNTAQKVYKTIHEELKRGSCKELKDYWDYYLSREGGEFTVEQIANGVRLMVRDCPALRHLVKLEQEPDLILCEATRIFNEALCEGSPYTARLEKSGTFACIQTIQKRKPPLFTFT